MKECSITKDKLDDTILELRKLKRIINNSPIQFEEPTINDDGEILDCGGPITTITMQKYNKLEHELEVYYKNKAIQCKGNAKQIIKVIEELLCLPEFIFYSEGGERMLDLIGVVISNT